MQLQLIYDEIAEKKAEQRKALDDYKDALKNNKPYQTLLSDVKELTSKKKVLELTTAQEVGLSEDRLDEMKRELKSKNEMLSDVAIRDLMDGKKVEVEDEDGNKYIPVWSVKFKKVR